MAQGNQPWVPTREEIDAECAKIRSEWTEEEFYVRAGLNWFLERDVYFGDVCQVGVGDGLTSATISRY